MAKMTAAMWRGYISRSAERLTDNHPDDIVATLVFLLREVDTGLRPQDGTDVMEAVKAALDQRVANGWGHWDSTEEVQ